MHGKTMRAALLAGTLLIGGGNAAAATPPRFTLKEVRHAARAANFSLDDGIRANGEQWFPVRETCRRTSARPLRFRCSIWGDRQSINDGGDDLVERMEYRVTRCSPSRTARTYWWFNLRAVLPVDARGGLRCRLAVYIWHNSDND